MLQLLPKPRTPITVAWGRRGDRGAPLVPYPCVCWSAPRQRAVCLGDEDGTGWDCPEGGNVCGVSPGSARTGGEISRKDWGLLCLNPSRGMRASDVPLAGDQFPAPLYRAGFDLGRVRCWGRVSGGRGEILAGSVTGGGRRNWMLCWIYFFFLPPHLKETPMSHPYTELRAS